MPATGLAMHTAHSMHAHHTQHACQYETIGLPTSKAVFSAPSLASMRLATSKERSWEENEVVEVWSGRPAYCQVCLEIEDL